MSLFDSDGIAVTLADMLHVEDSPELLALRCPRTDIPVWSIMRVAFLRLMMGDLLFNTGSLAPPVQARSLRTAGTLCRALLHNARVGRHLRSDILINTDAIGDTLREGRWYNRYADPFGDLPSGQAVVLTDMFEWEWHEPRHNDRIVYHAPIQVAAALAGRWGRHSTATRLAETATALVSERARSAIGWEMDDARRAAFVTWATHKIAGLAMRYDAYRRLLKRVQPKLLLGLAGCYGGHAPLIAAAKDAGVVTAEFQHGAISAGHDAYNFAPTIFATEAYRRTLPDYLLTYGPWWSAQVHAPVDCIEIGYPARAEKLLGIGPVPTTRRKVLILSDGIEFDLYLNLAREIATAMQGGELQVVLRPHPLERSSVVRRYGERVDDVAIDAEPDIYTSFASAHSLVSEVSTGLFEAVGLVDRIVLLNTAKARFAYPEHPFAKAQTAQEVVDFVCGRGSSLPSIDASDLWTRDWHGRYQCFLAEKVKL